MAVSKRKKKAPKGKGRAKASHGGKAKKSSTRTDPGRDLGISDDIFDIISRATVGGDQSELIAQGQRDFPGLNKFSNKFNAQHLASAESASRKLGPLAKIAQKLGGGAIEIYEAFIEDTNNRNRPGAAEDTALDFASNRIGREVGTAGPEDEAGVRARGTAELNRLQAGIQDGSIDPFQLQRDEAPIAGRIAQIPQLIDDKIIPGAAKLLGVDATTNIPEHIGKFLKRGPRRASSSIPRGKKGGRMTAEAAASGRDVARQRFAVGGKAGASTLGETTSESETETTFKESGTGFTKNIADTGALDNIISQLRGVKGFSNLGRSTLDDVLRTGLPTDVSGITEAAKIRASQEFDDATNVIGERLANLGLVSSSAQTTAVARERAKLGERVSAAGLEAQVAAAEAAANRRFGGIGLDTAGAKVGAGALGSAGSLAASSAGLNSSTETGFNKFGSSSSFGSSISTSNTNLSPTGKAENATQRRQRLAREAKRSKGGGGGSGGVGSSSGFHSLFAKGGRVPELDDVLSGVLEGTFNPTADTLTKADRLEAERGRIDRFEEDNVGLANSRKEIGEFLQVNHPGILRMLLGGARGNQASTNVANPGTNVTPAMQANIDRSAKRAHAGARTPFALGGPVEGDPEPISAPNKGAVPQPVLPQENGQMVPGLLDPRRQFFEEGGGVAPGVDSGEDKVPALLRSEELVVTPELVDELMNIDPSLPQPGLITALQQLAQQPLEFGEEEGELVAGHGGSVSSTPQNDLFKLLMDAGVIPKEQPESFAPGFTNVSPQFGLPGQDITIENVLGSSKQRNTPNFPGEFLPGASDSGQSFDSLLEGEDFGTPDFSVPGPPLRAPSFSESVGEAGERKFTLDGGTGTGRVGAAGIRAGLDPSKGRVSGGEGFAPSVERIGPGGRGRIEIGAITDPETGLPMDFSGEQMSRLERAQRIADLTRAAISTDPIGGPEKQSRMLRALEIANREVDSSVNEIIQGQKLAIERQQVQNAGVVAQGQLNASIAQTLQAQAQKVTAEGALAKQVAELAANNPVVTAAMNKLELLAKNPEMDPDDRDRILAILTRELQIAGIELTESGFFADLFGAPGFTISPVAQEQGVPDPEGRNDGQQELQTLMSRAKAGMSTEDFQHIMEIM